MVLFTIASRNIKYVGLNITKDVSQFPQIGYKLTQSQRKSQKTFYFGGNWYADSKIYKEMQKVKNSWGNFEEEKQSWSI